MDMERMTMAHRLLAALALALCAAAPACAAPAPATPAATRFTIGGIGFVALRDMTNVVPNDGSVFGIGVPTAQVAAVLKAQGAATDRIPLGVDALLAKLPGHVVLLDTGLGPKVGGVLPLSLAEAHVAPADVTDILITHSHPDHIGGLVTKDGGLAFPNAVIRMSAPEWAFLQARGNKALVEAIRPQVQPFEPGAEVLPGIRSVPLPGHTPGHSGYRIGAGRETLLDIGDTAHSAVVSLARPDWTIGYDTDARQGRTQREAELATLAASHQRIFAPHFPYPGVGTIVKAGGGYRWQPDSLR
jgi:glyoxylase-like metal-dependent hydrolase (beta-lactamase superfamily II)